MSSPNLAQSAPPNSGQRSRSFLLLGGIAALLTLGYSFGYLVRPGGAGEQTLHSLEASSAGSMVYLLAAGVALVVLIALLRGTNIAPWRRNPFAGRPVKPIAAFVEESKADEISLRVAREAYHLLQHHYPRPMCIDLNDDLRRDLRMSAGNILALRSGLLGRTDRLEQNVGDEGKIVTVRHLLKSVESSPKNGVDRAKLKQRVTDLPFEARPVVENLEFTEKSELADPDFMRRAHFKWLKRRSADYQGFRSRLSDALGGQQGHHPFRRANEMSKRLSVRQEAGRLAKEAAEKRAIEQKHHEAGWLASLNERDPSDQQTAYHGY
jgi:hypothetical protein